VWRQFKFLESQGATEKTGYETAHEDYYEDSTGEMWKSSLDGLGDTTAEVI